MWAVKGLSMEKWLCWGSMGVAGFLLLLFVVDIPLGIPFGGLSIPVDIIGILASDTGLLALPAFAGSAPPRDLLVARLLPTRSSPRDIVRAWSAIGAAQVAVARTLDQPEDVVREVAARAALAAYDS